MTIRRSPARVGTRLAALAAVVAGAAVATGCVDDASPEASAPPSSAEALSLTPDERAEAQRLLDTLRDQNTSPGAGITFGVGDEDMTLSSGTRDVRDSLPIRSTDKVRVGSITKTYVASVVLQLVAEDELELDVPVERYVPGVLRYPDGTVPGEPADHDGRAVTVRQLLQHTAGIADYAADLGYVMDPAHQAVAPTPETLLAHGLREGPTQLPGSDWSYSNTHYTLLGMIVEAVTGRTIGTEIRVRIVEPLGLADTFFAEEGQRQLPGGHVSGYLNAANPIDYTNLEPAVWGTAGALVSSPDDMNTFVTALLDGEVVPPDLLDEMQDDVPAGDGDGYGLGLMRVSLSCGDAWGHGGFVAGYQTVSLGFPDGRHGFVTLNTSVASPPVPDTAVTSYDLLDLVLC